MGAEIQESFKPGWWQPTSGKYLHHVLLLWLERTLRKRLSGSGIGKLCIL